MENKELLNPESDKNKKTDGVENLNPEQEQQKPEETENQESPQTESEPTATEKKEAQKTSETAEEKETPESTEEKETPGAVEEKETTEAVEEKETTGTVEEKETTESIEDKQTPEAVEEKETSEAVEEKETLEAVEKKETTEDVEEKETPEAVEEKKTTEAVEEKETPDATEDKDRSEALVVAKTEESPVAEKEEEKKQVAEKESEPAKAEAEPVVDESGEDDDEDETANHADHDDNDSTEADDLTAKYNSLSKAELVEALEALVESDDINYIRKHIGYIKVAFRNYLKEQSVSEYEKNLSKAEQDEEEVQAEKPVDELAVRFDKAFGVYKHKKSIFDQAAEKQKQDNLKEKEAILEELRNLIESEEELKKTYDVFKELQEKWRNLGPVPQGAKNTLWNNYHFLVEKFFDKVKINKELRDLDLKKNLEAKTELCEKAEELLLETSVNKSFQKLQKLHEAWKESGPVPKDKKDEIWDRFKAASDTLNDRRQAYYDSLRDEQNKNFAAKILLCEQAESLSEFTSDSPRKWQEATDKINELFKLWKSIGFAPKKVNDEVWVRFRSALDSFFKKKKDFFFRYKEDQTENYNQKLNLCVQAEALKDSEDWKQTTDELITLQQQWKKIGPVPKKFSDKVWKRFRAACDEFFHRKADYFSNIGEKQEENLRKKKELVETVKTYQYSKDNTENLNVLKDFQRQFMEIGHVPIKEKDKIQNEFRAVVNEQFEKLNISRKAKTTIGFKNKIENLKNSPNADNILYKERNFLVNKINGLQNDIKLWENNIGFFASSKKADVLKAEFEKKISDARADIAILEEKLKIINAS